VFVGGGAAAEQAQGFVAGVPELVLPAGRNGDGVPGPDFARFVFDADFSRAVRDMINFLGTRMKMFLRAAADRQARLGEALVADGGVRCASSSRISEPSLVVNGATSFRFLTSIFHPYFLTTKYTKNKR
jgi:hypothetical protein